MVQTWEKGKKPIFVPNFGPLLEGGGGGYLY